METINRIILLLTAGIVAGESLLLLIGMNLPLPSAWVTIKNVSLAISDILAGGTLIYLSLSAPHIQNSPVYYILSLFLLITHGYREYEYLARLSNAFCENVPLFIFNNAKLFGVFLSTGISLLTGFKSL